jgi:hypothetical protein
MLGRLSGAFSMENMGGAGAAYAQNIRDYNAPELDANDEESLLARQRWAQSNGYQEEANQLGVTLGDLRLRNEGVAKKREFAGMSTSMEEMQSQRAAALGAARARHQETIGQTQGFFGGENPQDMIKLAQEEAAINQNFDRAEATLMGRINDTAAGIDGMTGLEGTELKKRNNTTRAMKSALINNGLSALADLAPVLTPETLSTLLKDKNAAGKIGTVGHPQVFGNHAIQLAQDDGSAILIAPGYKEPINSRDNPELYETVLAEAVKSGPVMTAEAKGVERQEERRYEALKEADTYFLEAGNGIADARRAREETQAIIDSMTPDKDGNIKLDTGLVSGFLMKWGGIGSQELGELSALEIEQVLQNLQITKLTPVSNEEIKLISQMWANAMTGREVNLGRLNVAMRRMQHNMANLERSGQSRIDLLRNTGSGAEADRYQAQWDEITQSETSTALGHESVSEYDTSKGPVRTQQNDPYVPLPTLESIMVTPSTRPNS